MQCNVKLWCTLNHHVIYLRVTNSKFKWKHTTMVSLICRKKTHAVPLIRHCFIEYSFGDSVITVFKLFRVRCLWFYSVKYRHVDESFWFCEQACFACCFFFHFVNHNIVLTDAAGWGIPFSTANRISFMWIERYKDSYWTDLEFIFLSSTILLAGGDVRKYFVAIVIYLNS